MYTLDILEEIHCTEESGILALGANFGQGAPEVGPIPGGTERPRTIDLSAMGDEINE